MGEIIILTYQCFAGACFGQLRSERFKRQQWRIHRYKCFPYTVGQATQESRLCRCSGRPCRFGCCERVCTSLAIHFKCARALYCRAAPTKDWVRRFHFIDHRFGGAISITLSPTPLFALCLATRLLREHYRSSTTDKKDYTTVFRTVVQHLNVPLFIDTLRLHEWTPSPIFGCTVGFGSWSAYPGALKIHEWNASDEASFFCH